MDHERSLKDLQEENERLKKYLEWYKATYEQRSLLGLVKEKSKQNSKKWYTRILKSILKSKYVKKKYAIAYAIEYAIENGLWNGISHTKDSIKTQGLKGTRVDFHRNAEEKYKNLFRVNYAPILPTIPDLTNLIEEEKKFKKRPKISLVFPTYNTKPELLRIAIESIQNQIYSNWEICIVDDGSSRLDTLELLSIFEKESNIKVSYLAKNAGISVASNKAIKLATGDYIALMDHDDEITPDALYWIVKEINEQPSVEIIYTDECKADEAGNLSDYFFKPDWSPELLINSMYVGHLTVYEKNFLLKKVGLFRKDYDFSQDYDLMHRATEKAKNIRHISKVLYHWRITEGSSSQGDKPYARISNLAAVADAARRRNIDGEIIELPTANRLKIKVPVSRKVSIIIPTDSYENLKEAIESLLTYTNYPAFEIVPVTNSRLISQMKEIFQDSRICYATYDRPYNFSDKCNVGAEQSTGNIVLFFNDDVRPLEIEWLENTIEFLQLPGIGGVSPKLIYENDTIQYAGMATGVRNLIGTTLHCYHKDSIDYINYPQLVRNVSILSGACMAMPKDLFFKIGGFDAINTPSAHSDVDISFKILEEGLRLVYTPYACLRHIGHNSLKEYEQTDKVIKKKDKADIFLMKRWMKYLPEDKYFTEPMKNYLYHDSREYYKIYAPEIELKDKNKGDIIMVSHDLSLSGAPLSFYDSCKVLSNNGYFVVIFSPVDGPLRKMYQEIGIPVIVDELVLRQHDSFERFAKNFDYIICNTIVTWPVIKQMQEIVKTVWWVQEGQAIELFTTNEDCANTLRNAKNLIGLTDYAMAFLKPYNTNLTKIYNASFDIAEPNKQATIKNISKNKIIFTIIGSIEGRKGQDILINALDFIPENLKNQIEIRIVGRTLDYNYKSILDEKIKDKDNIILTGEVSRQQSLNYMKESDVIITASRDEPQSVALVEAFCLGKTCIVSSNTGMQELINDGENGFCFENENPQDLAAKISFVLDNPELLKSIGDNARKTYEKHLTMEIFEKKLLSIIQVNKKEEKELILG